MIRIDARRAVRDESGVALPLALVGLVSVSLLVTTAILTSSTEYAISAAHEDAARALYVAEGGLQAYVAENGTVLGDFAGLGEMEYRPAGSSPEERVNVSVMHLGTTTTPAGTLRVYSVAAEPVVGGGRRVMSMVRQVLPTVNPLDLNVQSALTLGSDLSVVNGNAFEVSGASACGGAGVEAVRLAEGADVEVRSQFVDNFTGVDDYGRPLEGEAAIQETDLSRQQLADEVLAGQTLAEIVDQLPAAVKWGPRFSPPGSPRTFNGTVPSPPGVAVVDGNGGYVRVTSGSGLLIVVNGNLEMGGSARFDGVIIVEGSFWLHGSPRVTGALISLAYEAENRIELDAESTLSGNITVQFDQCSVETARDGFADVVEDHQVPQVPATFSWLEMAG